MSSGWYKKAQESQDPVELIEDTMKFTEELMAEFEQLQHYVAFIIPRRARAIAEIATDPEKAGDLIPALNRWSAEIMQVNQRLATAAANNQASHITLQKQWKDFKSSAEQMHMETQMTQSVEGRGTEVMQ